MEPTAELYKLYVKASKKSKKKKKKSKKKESEKEYIKEHLLQAFSLGIRSCKGPVKNDLGQSPNHFIEPGHLRYGTIISSELTRVMRAERKERPRGPRLRRCGVGGSEAERL